MGRGIALNTLPSSPSDIQLYQVQLFYLPVSQLYLHKGSCKKIIVFFLVARPQFFFPELFLELQKTVFFLSGQDLTPTPLLSGRAIKIGRHFFAASLKAKRVGKHIFAFDQAENMFNQCLTNHLQFCRSLSFSSSTWIFALLLYL